VTQWHKIWALTQFQNWKQKPTLMRQKCVKTLAWTGRPFSRSFDRPEVTQSLRKSWRKSWRNVVKANLGRTIRLTVTSPLNKYVKARIKTNFWRFTVFWSKNIWPIDVWSTQQIKWHVGQSNVGVGQSVKLFSVKKL